MGMGSEVPQSGGASRTRFVLAVAALTALILSIVFSGAQPPWAWGFLQGLVMALGAVWLVLQCKQPGYEIRLLIDRPARWLVLSGLLFLGWLTLTHLFNREDPVLARVPIVYSYFLTACFLVGCTWGSKNRLMWLMVILTGTGLVLSLFGFLRLYTPLWPSLWGFGTTERLQGFYTNPNRYAVLLAVCWCCGAGATGYWWCRATRHRGSREAITDRRYGMALAVCTLVIAAAMVLTYSRLTLVSSLLVLLVGAGAAAYATRSWRVDKAANVGPQPHVRTYLLASGLVAMVGLLVAGLVLTLGGRRLVERAGQVSPDLDGRLSLMQTGVELWQEAPLTGRGLGRLETLFLANCPVEQQHMRVVEVHNDWLQLGIETGGIGLLLALLLAATFVVLWCRSLGRTHRLRTRLLLTGSGVAIVVPLICSVADFPLRQPSSAGLVFLLAGAVLVRGLGERDAEETGSRRPGILPVAVVLLLAFAIGSAFSLRRGVAVAATPWLGHVYARPAEASDVEGYQRGCRIDASAPQLWFGLAQARLKRIEDAKGPEREQEKAQFQEAAGRLEALLPNDYRPHYLRALLAFKEDHWDAGLASVQKALKHAHFSFIHDLERDLVLSALQTTRYLSPERPRRLQEALACLRQGVIEERWAERDAIQWLLSWDVLPSEIAGLWEEQGPEGRIRRARFYLKHELMDRAQAELNGLSEDAQKSSWFMAMRCYLDLSGGQAERGLETFSVLIRRLQRSPELHILHWLKDHLSQLPPEMVLLLVKNEGTFMSEFEHLARALLPKLTDASAREAERFWCKVVQRKSTPENLRRWAELAAQMGDRPAARFRARDAWERSSRNDEWNRWYAAFRRKYKLND